MAKAAILALVAATVWSDRALAALTIELAEREAYARPVDFSLDASHAFVVYARYSSHSAALAAENYDLVLQIRARESGAEVATVNAAQLWGDRLDHGLVPRARIVPHREGVVVATSDSDRTTHLAHVDQGGKVLARRRVEDFVVESLGRHRDFIWASASDRVALFGGRLDLQSEWPSGDALLAVESAGQELVALHGVRDPSSGTFGLFAGTVRWIGPHGGAPERMEISVPVPVTALPFPRLLAWPDGLSLVTRVASDTAQGWDWRECRLAFADGEFRCGEPAWGHDLKALHPEVHFHVKIVQGRDGYVAMAMTGCGIWSRRYGRSHAIAPQQLTFPNGSSDLGVVHSFLAKEWGDSVFLLTSAVLTTGWDPAANSEDKGTHRLVLREGVLTSGAVQQTPSFEGCPGWSDERFARRLTADEVRSCVAKGADPNAEFNCGAWTRPLAMAALEGNEAAVRALIEAGADVNAQDDEGNAALHNAARHAQSEGILRALLDGGADATLRNRRGKLAWDYARDNEALKDSDIVRRRLEPTDI